MPVGDSDGRADRHRLADLLAHGDRAPARWVLAGASGLVGGPLAALLTAGGHTVTRLVRRAPGPGEVAWDPAAGRLDPTALDGADVLVNLAGEGIADRRWTAARKRALVDSRLGATSTIARALAAGGHRPRVWINASAVGVYGDRGEDLLDETSPPGTGFLADLCRAWEAATAGAPGPVVHLRIGVVLTALGGALARMLGPARLGALGPLAGGRQWMPWTSLADLLDLVLRLGDGDMAGPVNAVAPAPVRQVELARAIAGRLHRPAVLPLPRLAVEALFGEMGRETLLVSQRVVSRRRPIGWRHPTLDALLDDEIGP